MTDLYLRKRVTAKVKIAATGTVLAISLLAGCGGAGAQNSSGGTGSSVDGGTAPTITSGSAVSVNEGINVVFYKASANTSAGRTATWSLSGADSNRFTVNPATGELSFITAPKYGAPSDSKGDSKYKVVLAVSDGVRSTKQDLTVEVSPWNAGGQNGLPVPLGQDVAKPSGTGAYLKVLPWAGFKSAVSYTFDDSSPSQIENWPTLKVQGVRVTFYIMPGANWFG